MAMRLCEREKQNVYVHPFTGMQEDVYTFGAPVSIRAAVYPMGETMEVKAYGERVRAMRRMLYDGQTALEVGMGISFDGGMPDYRVVSLEMWSHQSAVLERIPEGRRG